MQNLFVVTAYALKVLFYSEVLKNKKFSIFPIVKLLTYVFMDK